MKTRNWWWICLLAAVALFGLSDFLKIAEAQNDSAREAPAGAGKKSGEKGSTPKPDALKGGKKEKKDTKKGGENSGAEAKEEAAVSGEKSAAEKAADRLEQFRTKEATYAGKIVVIPIEDDSLIISARFKFMQRTLERAEEEGATAVILDMDTPGGSAWETGQLIMNYLPKMTMPTYTYVNSNAASAGAIIAVATDTIYMAPVAAIGAAKPVLSSGADVPEAMEKKLDSYLRAQVRSVAKAKGHNPDLAEAFINEDLEVSVEVGADKAEEYPMGMKVISRKGELLSLDHEEATEVFEGKPLLAKGIAKDLEDLVAKEGLKGEMVVATPLGMESFAMWVSRLAGLLLMLGIAGAYMEMQAPGFGIPGAVSIVCFAIFFFGHYAAGNLAGFEVVAIFVLGLVLIGVEIFLLPGTIVFGLAGAVLMLGALVYTMAGTSIGGDAEAGAFSINVGGLGAAMRNLALGMVGAVILVAVLLRFLPETRAMSWLVLKTSVAGGASLEDAAGIGADASAGGGEGRAGLIGKRGVTLTALRPAGKGKFGSRTLDIVSEAEFVEAGVDVKIVEQQGSRIVVVEV